MYQNEPNPPNPVHQRVDGLWYFWDETWCHIYGGWETREECLEQLKRYCIEELGMTEEDFKKTEG